MGGSEFATSENQNPNVILCSDSKLSSNCTISTCQKYSNSRPLQNVTSATVEAAFEPSAIVNQNNKEVPDPSTESPSPIPYLNFPSMHCSDTDNGPPAVLGSVPSGKAPRGWPQKQSNDHLKSPSSVRPIDTNAKENAKMCKKGAKRKRSIVKGPLDTEIKESLHKKFSSELASLFSFYHEDPKLDLTVAGAHNVDRRTKVALLLEGSGLPFSSLVANLLLQLKTTGDGQCGNDLTLVSLRSLVLSVGERTCFGTPNPDADVLEDDTDACLWCWEVRDIRLFPEACRSLIVARRRKRRKIAERIAALSGMVAVLTAAYTKDEEQSKLEKAEDALLRTESEHSIRTHFIQWQNKKSAKKVVKEEKSRENEILKEQQRSVREIEKERRRISKEEEREKKWMVKEEAKKRMQEEKERRQMKKEKDRLEKEASKQRLKETLCQEKEFKKQQDEVEKDQKRKEKEEADLKKQSALKKQANIMDRFLQSKRDKETVPYLPSEPKVACRSSDAPLQEKVSHDMDRELSLCEERSTCKLLSSHLMAWKESSSMLSSRKSARWGQRRVPKRALVSELRLQGCHDNGSEGADNSQASIECLTGGGSKRSRTKFEECEVNARNFEGDWDDSGVMDFSDLMEPAAVEALEVKPSHCCMKRRKLLQFDKSHRPAYYGSFSKKSQVVRPRKPLKMDSTLDYENDSDEEWEEEDPGESLSDCEKDEEDEKPDAEEDEEAGDGFVVPDGYLSESEVAHVDESDSESDSGHSQCSQSRKTAVDCIGQPDGNQSLLKFGRQCKVLEQLTNQALQHNRPYIICNFYPNRSSALARKTDRICLEALKVCCLSNEIRVEVPEDPQLQEKADDSKRPIKRSKKALPEMAVRELVEILMSSTQGLKRLTDLLSTKFPTAARTQLKAKIKEIADFVDNHWQVKEEVLEQLGIRPACAQVASTSDPVSKSSSIRIKPITKFFFKRCLPPETAGLDDTSFVKRKENLCTKGNVASDANILRRDGNTISLEAANAIQSM